MKKICFGIVLTLMISLLFGCAAAPLIEAGSLQPEDLRFYDTDNNVLEDPEDNEDGMAFAFSHDETRRTARGIKIGDSLKSVCEAYKDCEADISSTKYFDDVKYISLEDFNENYDKFKFDSNIGISFTDPIYGMLSFTITDGKVASIRTYTAEACRKRDEEIQKMVDEEMKKIFGE